MSIDRRHWFAATPFGHGWWRPSHWLGWLSVLAAVALAFLAGRIFPPATAPLPFWIAIAAIAVGFLAQCRIKGEPLRRRTG